MKRKLTLSLLAAIASTPLFSQNLVVNPSAEILPAATGWTVVSQGGACAFPANTFTNWTLVPGGTPNYPAARTGTRTFFAGCNPTAGVTYELYQDIDVSGSATQIDAGSVSYTFSGYIQTPIAAQGDVGRFIVDYRNAANAVIGTSYTVSQSGTGGSGSAWNLYTDTRTAPVGTRTVRIRLQSTLAVVPAVNAYFDDISLVQNSTLPIKLVSFNALSADNRVDVKWKTSDATNFSSFVVERSTDGTHYIPLTTISYQDGRDAYEFADNQPPSAGRIYYRLKLNDADGRYNYSSVLLVNRSAVNNPFSISPNPASGVVVVSGLKGKGTIYVNNLSGSRLLQLPVTASSLSIDLSTLPKGVYIVQYVDDKEMRSEKLYVQ